MLVRRLSSAVSDGMQTVEEDARRIEQLAGDVAYQTEL